MASRTEFPFRVVKSSELNSDNRSWLTQQNLEVLRDSHDVLANTVASLPPPTPPYTPPALAWTTVGSFSNGWVDEGSGTYYSPGYAKDISGGLIYLRGALKSGTNGTVAFTLPAGFRPAKSVLLATMVIGGAGNFAGFVTVTSGGAVTLATGAATIVVFALDGAYFAL